MSVKPKVRRGWDGCGYCSLYFENREQHGHAAFVQPAIWSGGMYRWTAYNPDYGDDEDLPEDYCGHFLASGHAASIPEAQAAAEAALKAAGYEFEEPAP